MREPEPGWYERGTDYIPGVSWVRNNTGEPIRVSTREQIQAGKDYIDRMYGDKEEGVD